MCEHISSILREIFPSPEMASCLADCALSREKIRDAAAYAAIPLERKRDIFLRLASGKDRRYFRRQAGLVEAAIREMQTRPGEFFCLEGCCYSEEDPMGRSVETLEPYLTWGHVLERIREYLGYFEADEKELVWFHVDKWSPDGTGRLKNEYGFTVLGTEVCYFYQASSHWYDFSTDRDLNLPVPFHAGDIVTVDCRPFVPVSHGVILEVGDNRDCCCFQALFRKSDGTWDTGAVKHGHIVPNGYAPISPLYRLASFHGQLTEKEHLLEKVSRYVDGDEERGAALWNYIYDFRSLDSGKEWPPVTEEQILSYIENGDSAAPTARIQDIARSGLSEHGDGACPLPV